MTHGHELRWGVVGGNGGYRVEAGKGGKIWDNCNSIINRMYLKNKTTMRYHLIPVRMTIINKSRNYNCWQRGEEKGTFMHCWWEDRTGATAVESRMEFPQKIKKETVL